MVVFYYFLVKQYLLKFQNNSPQIYLCYRKKTYMILVCTQRIYTYLKYPNIFVNELTALYIQVYGNMALWISRDSDNPGVDWRIILKWTLEKRDEGVRDWTDLAQDRSGGGLLWMRWRTFGFRKMRKISWVAENRLVLRKDSAPWRELVSLEILIKVWM
jgi:hypothetical protein